MTRDEIIDIIARNKDLKEYCRRLCGGDSIYKDVHQTFLLGLCEMSDANLIDKFNNTQLIGYCYSVIKRLNQNRVRDCKWNVTSNTLVSGNYKKIDGLDNVPDEPYNYEIDQRFNDTMEFIEGNKKIKKYQAVILFNSVNKTTKEIAEAIGTKERVVIYQNNKVKNLIKAHVK